jgi:hypothetical protein
MGFHLVDDVDRAVGMNVRDDLADGVRSDVDGSYPPSALGFGL